MLDYQFRRCRLLLVLILLAAAVWLVALKATPPQSQQISVTVTPSENGLRKYHEPQGGQSAPVRPSAFSEEAVGCMAAALYFEARSEGYSGMNAVAQTIKNRVSSPRWPGSVCGVISEPLQFSFLNGGHPGPVQNNKAWLKAQRLAQVVLSGQVADPTFGATHYHADYVAPSWSQSQLLTRTTTVGAHHFYRISRVLAGAI